MFRNDAKSAVQFVFEQRKTWGKTNIHLRLIRKTLIKKYRWYFCSAFGPPGIRIRRPFRLFCVHPKLNRTPLILCGRMGLVKSRPWFFSFLVLCFYRHQESNHSMVPSSTAHTLISFVKNKLRSYEFPSSSIQTLRSSPRKPSHATIF